MGIHKGSKHGRQQGRQTWTSTQWSNMDVNVDINIDINKSVLPVVLLWEWQMWSADLCGLIQDNDHVNWTCFCSKTAVTWIRRVFQKKGSKTYSWTLSWPTLRWETPSNWLQNSRSELVQSTLSMFTGVPIPWETMTTIGKKRIYLLYLDRIVGNNTGLWRLRTQK